MSTLVTAKMLYNLVACSHRVTIDLSADSAQRDEPNPFVELLWERGQLYEREVISGLRSPFTDLSLYAANEKERLTLAAMQRGEPLIYAGRIQIDGMLGEPDLLRKEGNGYVAGDIKSGAGEEGPEDSSKPKIRYAVQLGLYTDILERNGLSSVRRAFVWDVHGDEVPYDFQAVSGVAGVMIASKAEIPAWLLELVSPTAPSSAADGSSLTNYVRFHDAEIGNGDVMTTGLRFPDLAHLSEPESGWCYLTRRQGRGEAGYRLTVAEQEGSAPPIFVEVKDDAARAFGRTAEEIEQLARLHCDFTVPEG